MRSKDEEAEFGGYYYYAQFFVLIMWLCNDLGTCRVLCFTWKPMGLCPRMCIHVAILVLLTHTPIDYFTHSIRLVDTIIM